MVRSWKHVREQEKVIFPLIAWLSGQLQAIEIRMRNQHKFCLSALVRAHSRISVGRMSVLRIHDQARFRVSAMAVETIAAGDVKRQHHAVPLLDALDR